MKEGTRVRYLPKVGGMHLKLATVVEQVELKNKDPTKIVFLFDDPTLRNNTYGGCWRCSPKDLEILPI